MDEKVCQAGRKSILLLLPDMPASVGTGGQVRAFQFANALAEVSDVTACIFVDQSQDLIPQELKSKFTMIHQPNSASRGESASQTPSAPIGLLRVLSVLFLPWRKNGFDLINAGNVNCVVRAESKKNSNLSLLHSLYARLLQAELSLIKRLFYIYPSDALIRINSFYKIFPAILTGMKNTEPDIIWCEHSYLFPIAERLKKHFRNAKIVVNAHNVEWILKQGISKTMKTPLARRWILTESAILKYWERRMLLRTYQVFCCSEQDAGRFRELVPVGGARLIVIPNGVDTDYFNPLPAKTGVPTLLFAGTAGYPPNDDAVAWMIADILPLVRQKVPDCILILAGRSAAKQWSHYAEDDPQIEIASDVPDMRLWLVKATVCVVPLRAGSGTRLKILEAMGAGRAVVSTRLGAEGIGVEHEKHLLIADSPENFADSIIILLKNEKTRHSLEDASHKLVVEKYEWSCITRMALESLDLI